MKTAFRIQEVLREELEHSTVITIAHRVEAVRDANYRIILDKGRVIESGEITGTSVR
jgi:ABC-type multidrug transport system fused ATPase/permease subunit